MQAHLTSFWGLKLPVSIVVDQLCAGLDVSLGHKDEPGGVGVQRDNLGHAVGGPAAVVDQSPVPTALRCRVNAELYEIKIILRRKLRDVAAKLQILYNKLQQSVLAAAPPSYRTFQPAEPAQS